MTKEQLDKIASDYLNDCESELDMLEVFAVAKEALEQEPCDDCVSREAILNELSKWNWQDLYLPIHFKELIIDALPSVQPNREKHDEEIIKKTVESIWGKPPYTEVLDAIRAEIEQYKADCDLTCSDDSNCRTCNNITFGTIYQIIDKYRKGQTDADSD